jgi:murein DD-endopeptidase MepM/ murein hydrolase activator NlpD
MLPVANYFRTSDLHKRIVYMKRKTFKASALKLALLLPLITIAVVGFAQTKTNVVYDSPEAEQFHSPVQDVQISARYGNRTNPVTKEEAFHSGVDFISTNDTIRAPYSGVVESAVFENDLGNVLKITHSDGLETLYAHLASFLVKEGEVVKGGEPIAIIGTTGLSTGKHLHFETRINGELVNPVELFRQGGMLKINVID